MGFDFRGKPFDRETPIRVKDLAIFEDVDRPYDHVNIVFFLQTCRLWEGGKCNQTFSRQAVRTALWWISTKIGTVLTSLVNSTLGPVEVFFLASPHDSFRHCTHGND